MLDVNVVNTVVCVVQHCLNLGELDACRLWFHTVLTEYLPALTCATRSIRDHMCGTLPLLSGNHPCCAVLSILLVCCKAWRHPTHTLLGSALTDKHSGESGSLPSCTWHAPRHVCALYACLAQHSEAKEQAPQTHAASELTSQYCAPIAASHLGLV